MKPPGIILAALGLWLWAHGAAGAEKPNVLFIAVDDLRPELGCFGDRHIVSPNIDALAERGLRFTRAYSQYALCSPSRNSVFSGRRPDTTRVFNGRVTFRGALPDIVALPQLFKNNGYFTRGFGKILHHNGQDDPISWSEPMFWPTGGVYAHSDNRDCEITMDRPENFDNPLTEMADVADNAYQDGMVADEAIRVMRRVRDEPFFLAVGFYKPHTPFNAPKKYWDLYDRGEIELAGNSFAPAGAPEAAMADFRYVRSFRDVPDEGPLSEDTARRLKHAYYACVSFVDAQIGRLLDELDQLGLAGNTIVLLWSDHGYQLGEHGLWCKHTNFETSVRTPILLSAPGQSNAGGESKALVELVDIYPTLADLCGLDLAEGLEGTSMAPLLDDPGRPWKSAAFSQFFRGALKGYTMRTARYRLTLWLSGKDADRVEAVELYDHEIDPDENTNIAARPENAALVDELSQQLRAGWRAARPVGGVAELQTFGDR